MSYHKNLSKRRGTRRRMYQRYFSRLLQYAGTMRFRVREVPDATTNSFRVSTHTRLISYAAIVRDRTDEFWLYETEPMSASVVLRIIFNRHLEEELSKGCGYRGALSNAYLKGIQAVICYLREKTS